MLTLCRYHKTPQNIKMQKRRIKTNESPAMDILVTMESRVEVWLRFDWPLAVLTSVSNRGRLGT